MAVIIALAAGLYYFYDGRSRKEITAWQLIPAKSIAVLETSSASTVSKLHLDSTGFVKHLDSLKAPSASGPLLFCFQSTGKKIEWSALLPKGFPSPLDGLAEKTKATVRQRTYEGKTLFDLSLTNKPWITMAQIEGIWTASPSAILVEEFVRQNQSETGGFRSAYQKIFSLSTIRQDDGNLYVNWTALPSFVNGKLPDHLQSARLLCHTMVYDLRWTEDALLLNGFATDSVKTGSTLLSLFDGQRSVPFRLHRIVPEQFKYLVQVGFSDPLAWFEKRDAFCAVNAAAISQSARALCDDLNFQQEEYAKSLDDEIIYCMLDNDVPVILVELKEITRALKQLTRVREKLSKDGRHEMENYGGSAIHVFKRPDALVSLTWPLSFSSQEVAFAVQGNLLILSPEVKSVRRMIDLVEADNTLGKSVTWNRFFESTLSEGNVSVIFNGDQSHGDGPSRLDQIGKLSLGFYTLGENYYASAAMTFANAPQKKTSSRKVVNAIPLGVPLAHQPWVVKNHTGPNAEVLVFDSSNNLRLYTPGGELLWQKALVSAITTEVIQMDYFRNGKLQYAFCTAGQLHLVDRLGRDVMGFPKTIDVKTPLWISLIDYDNTRKYRILVADDDGRIVVMDKDGKPLDGWNPKDLGRNFISSPAHTRIGRKDYYMTVTGRGEVNLFTRRGEIVKGFPFQSGFVPQGSAFSDGRSIALVSESGRLIKVNDKGVIEFEEILLKNTPQAKFNLVVASDASSFIVSRLERGNFALFDGAGRQLFEIVNPGSDKLSLQYHRFAKNKEIVLVTDVDQKLFYVVDMSGNMLLETPMETDFIPGVSYSSSAGKLSFFIPDNADLELLNISF